MKKIPFMNLSTNPTKFFNKCEVTFTSQHKRLKAKWFTNERQNVSISELLTHQGTRDNWSHKKRHNNQPHSARARRRGSQSLCMPKIAGASSRQLRMTITCAKIWRRWRHIIEQNASPWYAQTKLQGTKLWLLTMSKVCHEIQHSEDPCYVRQNIAIMMINTHTKKPSSTKLQLTKTTSGGGSAVAGWTNIGSVFH